MPSQRRRICRQATLGEIPPRVSAALPDSTAPAVTLHIGGDVWRIVFDPSMNETALTIPCERVIAVAHDVLRPDGSAVGRHVGEQFTEAVALAMYTSRAAREAAADDETRVKPVRMPYAPPGRDAGELSPAAPGGLGAGLLALTIQWRQNRLSLTLQRKSSGHRPSRKVF